MDYNCYVCHERIGFHSEKKPFKSRTHYEFEKRIRLEHYQNPVIF